MAEQNDMKSESYSIMHTRLRADEEYEITTIKGILILEKGHLNFYDETGKMIANYAPGYWMNVEKCE